MTTVRLRTTGNEQTILTATCSMHSLFLSRTTNEALGIEGLCAKLCVLHKTGTFSGHVKQRVNPKVQGSMFFIIRHIHNHTSIISSEMQVELKKNTAFT